MATMRFFFDLDADGSFWRDEKGDDMTDIADARNIAAALVADLVTHHRLDGVYRKFSCEVRNASGAVVHLAELEFRAYRPLTTITPVEGAR